MLKLLFLFIVLFITSALPEIFIIKGHIPADLSIKDLNKQYYRIYSLLNPGAPVDTSKVTIIFYKQSEKKILGARLPEWGGGGAIGKDSIVIPVDKAGVISEGNYHTIIIHEITHIALSRLYGFIKVPRWFHEGLAMSFAGEISFDDQLVLSKALLLNRIMNLDSIENLNRFDPFTAKTAYCVSHLAVQFLFDTYGYDLLPELFDATLKRHSFSIACTDVFGLSIHEYNEIIRKKIIEQYRYFFLFSDYSISGLLFLVLATIGFVITRHRNRIKKLKMEQEELLFVKTEENQPEQEQDIQ